MDKLAQLLKDDIRGATTLFQEALSAFMELLPRNLPAVTHGGVLLKNRFSAMGLFHNLHRLIRNEEDPSRLAELLNDLKSRQRDMQKSIAGHIVRSLPSTARILTVSHSGLVREALIAGSDRGKHLQVTCLRSAPRNEGEGLARLLKNHGIPTKIIEDTDFTETLQAADLVMTGCDLLARRFFINKTGTRALAAAAGKLHKEVWVLTDSLRYIPDFNPTAAIDSVFEIIPLESHVRIVNESGFISGADREKTGATLYPPGGQK